MTDEQIEEDWGLTRTDARAYLTEELHTAIRREHGTAPDDTHGTMPAPRVDPAFASWSDYYSNGY